MREVEYIPADMKSACYPSAVRLILLGTHVYIRKAQCRKFISRIRISWSRQQTRIANIRSVVSHITHIWFLARCIYSRR
jgi:hypothetical protein